LVAISIEIYAARRAYEIAAEYRQRGVRVILGGAHPTLFADECKPYCDSVFVGDGEFRWAEAVEDARRGKLKPLYHAPVGVAQPGGVLPRRDLFVGKGYLPITLMQFSRGCRFACEFCAVSSYFDKKHYIRQTDEVLAEIESQKRTYIFFVDDNFLSDQAAAKQFLRELVPMKIKWVSQASLDMTNDLELMGLLAESGCMGNVVGFESIEPRSVRLMKKAPNLMAKGAWDSYQSQVEILRDHHMQTWATFTLGHDFDTLGSIRATHEFAMRNKFCFAAYNILMPYPGTPLYDRLKRERRLLWDDKWWLHPEYRFNQAAFIPKNMTPDELTDAIWECRDEWNRPWSIFKRMWDFKTHMSSPSRLVLYLAYNPLYAKESYKKQGMLFGRERKVQLGTPVADSNTISRELVQAALPRTNGVVACEDLVESAVTDQP
jgi:radical SAM superfamily enzyme YgiQ (UPF0313 family)